MKRYEFIPRELFPGTTGDEFYKKIPANTYRGKKNNSRLF